MQTRHDAPEAPERRRPLHVIYLLDCSGSMRADGKVQALHTAMTESLPLLRAAAADSLIADMTVGAIGFADGARWLSDGLEPIDTFTWRLVVADGLTDLGAALHLAAMALERVSGSADMPLPPVLVLVSDGRPTDDYREGLAALLATPLGAQAVRLAVAIGRDADLDVLKEFIGVDHGIAPLRASEPEAIIEAMRRATSTATRIGLTAPEADLAERAFDSEIFTPDDEYP